MHTFQELGEFHTEDLGNPGLCWAYKDESFVGFIAELAKSRGWQCRPRHTFETWRRGTELSEPRLPDV
eukprot:2689942-Lingulodinium_polyedra.AAC.1